MERSYSLYGIVHEEGFPQQETVRNRFTFRFWAEPASGGHQPSDSYRSDESGGLTPPARQNPQVYLILRLAFRQKCR
jgi:hypothetical protein